MQRSSRRLRYGVVVVPSLLNACVSFGGDRLEGDGDRVEMINWKPADPEAMCNHVYGTVDTNIPLGIDFESGKAYSVVVSDVTETFVAQ